MGQAPSISDYELTDVIYNKSTKQGSVNFNYTVSWLYSCDTRNEQKEDYENVKFKVDSERNAIILEFQKIEERSTFEEF